MTPPRARLLALVGVFLVGGALRAQEPSSASTGASASSPAKARAGLHSQFTTVTQSHPAFDARYFGRNSLSADSEHETTVTSTLSRDVSLWAGAEICVDRTVLAS